MRLRWVNLLLFLLLFRSSSLLLLFPLPPSPSLRLISTPSCLPSFHLPITLRGENRGGSGAKTCWGRTWMMPRGRREEERAAAVHDHERIVVCGGGINGASLAYILAKQGKRPLLFDREWDQRGKHTFDHLDCVMGLIPSDWYKDRYLENASTRTFELHHAWQGELAALGLGYGGMQNATILEPITQTVPKMLFDKERALLLKLSNGSTAEASKFFPSTEEICQRFPWLSPEFVYGAYYVSEQDLAKRASPREVRNSLLLAAIKLGAEVRTENVTRVEVVDANSAEQKFRVVTEKNEVDADKLVLAMGPWSMAACSQWFNIDIPLQTCVNYAGVLRARPFDDVDDPCCVKTVMPWRKDTLPRDSELILVPRNESITWLGDVAEDVDPSVLTDPQAWHKHIQLSAQHAEVLLSGAVDLVPSLQEAEIIHTGIKFFGLYKDRRPIMGDLPGVKGAYIITACSLSSLFVGPGLCEGLAEIMAGGNASFLNASFFDIRRLEAQKDRIPREGEPMY